MPSTEVPRSHPVLIAGGGPGGLAAAIELGRAGVRCAVVEPRVDVTTDRPRAKTTSARTMELFRRWGLADRVRDASPMPVSFAQDAVFCTRLVGPRDHPVPERVRDDAEPREEYAEAGQQVPQPVVEAVLREAVAEAPTVGLLLGYRVLSAHDGEDGVLARVATPDGDRGRDARRLAAGLRRRGRREPGGVGARYEGAAGRCRT